MSQISVNSLQDHPTEIGEWILDAVNFPSLDSYPSTEAAVVDVLSYLEQEQIEVIDYDGSTYDAERAVRAALERTASLG